VAIGLEAKKAIVGEVNEVASNALSAVVAEYRGLTVAEMTEFRKLARERNVYLRVVRNTLAKRAVEGTEFACMSEKLVGPRIYGFSHEEPGGAARLFRDFGKDHDKLVVTAIGVGGEVHGAEQLEAVASLPTRDEALSKLAYVIKAPVGKLARALNDIPGRAVRVIAAVRDQKKES
jgi:large subunit ribosomal protein L10